jgi:putative metallohydrolase (TIGR04338 family)
VTVIPPARTRPAWAEAALEAMEERGLTLAEVAGEVGLSPRALGARLAGRVRPFTAEVGRMAEVLQMRPEELVAAGPPRRTGPDLELLTARDRKVYAAAGRVPAGRALRTVAATQAFVDVVLAGEWWIRACPDTRSVTVRGGRRTAGAPAWHESIIGPVGMTHVLHLPTWARRPLVVLHELAHVVVEPILWAKPHGPQFARAWVDLTAAVIDAETAGRLTAELRQEGISLAARSAVARDRQRGLAALDGMLG